MPLKHRANSFGTCCRQWSESCQHSCWYEGHRIARSALIGVGGMLLCTAITADEVRYRDQAGQVRSRQGTVVDFRNDTLILQVNGRDSKIAGDQVQSVQSDWNEAHVQALQRMDTADYAAALDLFREALRKEKRDWVRRRILADVTVCFANSAQYENACVTFLQIVQQDPLTPHWGDIPLAWPPLETPPGLANKARGWIANDRELLAARLLGASWLLTSAGDRSAAEQTLRSLARDEDVRVREMAHAQLWRIQLPKANANDLVQWRKRLSEMPNVLRAGPTYLQGQLELQLQLHPDAELTLLRVPVLYARQRVLSQLCLFAAAKALQAAGQTSESRVVYQQAAELLPESSLAVEARQRADE